MLAADCAALAVDWAWLTELTTEVMDPLAEMSMLSPMALRLVTYSVGIVADAIRASPAVILPAVRDSVKIVAMIA